MLDTPCSYVVWRALATHSIRQFPLHFPSNASPCAIIFQLDSTPIYSVTFNFLLLLVSMWRPRHRWVDNIRMDLQEVGCGHVDWVGLAQDRDSWRTLLSAVMNLWVPRNAGNFLTSCKPVSCSGRTLHHGVSKYVSRKLKITESSFLGMAWCWYQVFFNSLNSYCINLENMVPKPINAHKCIKAS